MIRVQTRLPRFCTNGSMGRIQVRSPAHHQRKRSYSAIKEANKIKEFSTNDDQMDNCLTSDMFMPESPCGNRVMVVVDSALEGKSALQWALSHSVQSQDTVILLYVTKNSIPNQGGGNSIRELNHRRAYNLLCSMKKICQLKKPGVKVEMVLQQGKEKGAKIVEEANKQSASLLVLGQKKNTIMRRLKSKLGRQKICKNTVEYCIENSSCMTIAVRRKSKKYGGGYLITTKSHKDFWLLA